MSNSSSLEDVHLYESSAVQVSMKLDTGFTVDYREIEAAPSLEGGLTTLVRLAAAHDTRRCVSILPHHAGDSGCG
jgi:hypothetical protein